MHPQRGWCDRESRQDRRAADAPASQRGQILPFSVVFLLLCAALFYFAVNTSELTVEKTRVIDAADAAAWSAGVVQARALNLNAYANRAIVANQVAIAQTLALTNELNHIASTVSATSAPGALKFAAGVVAATVPADPDGLERWLTHTAILGGSLVLLRGADTRSEVQTLANATAALGSVAIEAADLASTALATQMRLLWATGPLALDARSLAAAQDAASAMDPDIRIERGASGWLPGHGAAGLVHAYGGAERERLQRLVLAALDPVITNRDEDAYSAIWQSVGIDVGLQRRGATTMPDLDTWDVLDQQTSRVWAGSLFHPRRTRGYRFEGAHLRLGRTENQATVMLDGQLDQALTGFLARYGGMPVAYDVADTRDLSATANRIGFTVVARKAKTATRTAGHDAAVSPGGRLALFGAVPAHGEALRAMARAEVLFDAPRTDGVTEYPNLFNPYWRVRLAQPTASDWIGHGLGTF